MAEIHLAEPSIQSLLLSQRANGTEIGTATGFVAVCEDEHYLVTNWHVVSGRRPDDGALLSPTGAVPDELVIMHNVANKLGRWEPRVEPLSRKDGDPLWLEHPTHGRAVDVVALPLTETEGVAMYPYNPDIPGPLIRLSPSAQVSIIGFPFGRTGGGSLGIWVQGTLASEPDMEWNDLPCYLIDSRTRQGQSGSPVIVHRTGSYLNESGATVFDGDATRFIGVYSGRINPESDLGITWKLSALSEILGGQQLGAVPGN